MGRSSRGLSDGGSARRALGSSVISARGGAGCRASSDRPHGDDFTDGMYRAHGVSIARQRIQLTAHHFGPLTVKQASTTSCLRDKYLSAEGRYSAAALNEAISL